jgi:hypothetical protein
MGGTIDDTVEDDHSIGSFESDYDIRDYHYNYFHWQHYGFHYYSDCGFNYYSD